MPDQTLSVSLSSKELPGSGARSAEVVAFEAAVVDFFVEAADLLGVPKSVAAIYGVVFAAAEPVSFAEIEARLDISKGSISQGLRVLREVGAIKEVSAASDRAELFVPDLEMRKLALRFMDQRLAKHLTAGSDRIGDLKRAVPAANRVAAKELTLRLQSLQDWHTRIRQLLPVVKTFLKLAPG